MNQDGEVEIVLWHPVDFGAERVERLVLRPKAKHFRNVVVPMGADQKIDFRPYEMAVVGLRMAGKPDTLIDHLHPSDMFQVGAAVLGFLGGGPGSGTEP